MPLIRNPLSTRDSTAIKHTSIITMAQSYILGIATQFPELQNTVDGTEAFFKKWAKPGEA